MRLSGHGDHVPIVAVADAGVDTRVAPPEPLGVHPRVLERVPNRLEQQTLPRIHHARLDRRNPEEPRVELVDVVEEGSASGHVVVAARIAGNPAPRTRVAASVRYQVGAGFEQPPERGEVGGSGEPAGHAHNRDGVILVLRGGLARRLRLGLRGRSASVLDQFTGQVLGERGDVRIIEDQRVGRRVASPQGAIEPIAQLDGHQRVHAQIEEPDRWRRGRRQPQHGPHLALEEGHQHVPAFGGRSLPYPGKDVLRAGEESASASEAAESSSSSRGGRSSTASSNVDQSIAITTDVVTSWRTR